MKTLYIYNIENDKCITHDGHLQLGIHSHNAEKHIALCDAVAEKNDFEKINWIIQD